MKNFTLNLSGNKPNKPTLFIEVGMRENKPKETIRDEYYMVYSPDGDMTFIMKDTFKNDEPISTEVVGFHYGEPDEDSIKDFKNKPKATFEW